MSGTVRIGISGWTYKPWRGVFYPPKLGQKAELQYAANTFSSIEVNGTFYCLQRPSSFERWAAETPDDFVFAVKGSRFVTHMRRLREIRVPLANFFASGILKLGTKLGPILWQFPPNFQFDPGLLSGFFELLPRDANTAAELAAGHDHRLKGRADIEPGVERTIRHAMEIRHRSFVVPEFVALLRKHNIAVVCADTVEWPRLMDVTADFAYCRLHGSEELYASGYDDTALDRWAARAAAWARGQDSLDLDAPDGERASGKLAKPCAKRDVYVYFDNDAKVHAPFDAKRLATRVDKLLEKE